MIVVVMVGEGGEWRCTSQQTDIDAYTLFVLFFVYFLFLFFFGGGRGGNNLLMFVLSLFLFHLVFLIFLFIFGCDFARKLHDVL